MDFGRKFPTRAIKIAIASNPEQQMTLRIERASRFAASFLSSGSIKAELNLKVATGNKTMTMER
jgi:hypothetical protein